MRKLLSTFEKGLLAVATAGLLLMMLLTSIDALGRYLFKAPLRGNFEFTSLYLMVILVFATLSANYSQGVHVQLDVFTGRLKTRFGKNYTRAIALICLPVFALLTWHACVEALSKLTALETRMGWIPFPVYLSYFWVALGGATLSFRFLLDIVAPVDDDAGTAGKEDFSS